jgi:hypothetical protein
MRSAKLELLAVGAMVMIAAGVAAWDRYYPPSPMLAAAGLPGRAADAGGRHCGPWYRDTPVGSVALRWGTCSGPARDGAAQSGLERVGFDRWTRQLTAVHRSWRVPDSMAWTRAQDSIALALDRRGGTRLTCGRQINPALASIRASEVWRFPDYDVRLVAYGGASRQSVPVWQLQVNAFPGGAPECGGPRPRLF